MQRYNISGVISSSILYFLLFISIETYLSLEARLYMLLCCVLITVVLIETASG